MELDWDIDLLEEDLDLDEIEFFKPVQSGFQMRPYQTEAIEKVGAAFKDNQRLLLVMATGTGKTVVFSKLASKEAQRGTKVLVLAHLGELLEQAQEKMEREGLRVGMEKAEEYGSTNDDAVVASWQTLHRAGRLEAWTKDHFGLIIVDESHRSLSKGYQTILKYFDEARVLGVTATADRGDKRGLSEFYETIAFEYGLRQACLDGWLVRPIAKTIPMKIDLNGVKSKGGDLDAAEVGHRIEPFLGQIAKEIKKEASERRHMIFLPSVDTARKMSDAMVAQGFRSGWVSGDSDERFAVIERYKAGELDCLCNCMLLIEGFDHDAIDCVTVLRPTKIRGLLAQCVGRGTRPLKSAIPALNAAKTAEERRKILAESGKPNLLILDFLWLTARLDLAKPASLIARHAQVAKRMAEKNGDLLQLEEESERDYIDALKKEAAKHSRKKSRVIDPLMMAMALDDPELAEFEPATQWEAAAVTDGQKRLLHQFGVDAAKVKYRGQAHRLINGLIHRRKEGLAHPRQIEFFRRLGQDVSKISAADAGRMQKERIEKWTRKRNAEKQAKLQLKDPTE